MPGKTSAFTNAPKSHSPACSVMTRINKGRNGCPRRITTRAYNAAASTSAAVNSPRGNDPAIRSNAVISDSDIRKRASTGSATEATARDVAFSKTRLVSRAGCPSTPTRSSAISDKPMKPWSALNP
jgi:hypothetical protein